MITIKELPLKLIAALDEELGYNWREGELENGVWNECANVTLGENVIIKYATGRDHITLDLGGKLAFAACYEFAEVIMS